MDEEHLIAAAPDVALNPVRAHLRRRDDGLVRVRLVLDRVAGFADLLESDADDHAFAALRRAELIGRPLGSEVSPSAPRRCSGLR